MPTVVAMKVFRELLTKNSSLPSLLQNGCVPPPSETCHFPPDVEGVPSAEMRNGTTYVSGMPDSLELYASHLLSGESAAPPKPIFMSKSLTGFRSPFTGKAPIAPSAVR